ncbi:RING-box protein 2 isoform X2 [Capricornis sumatraensis]|uniref:RING-box protein 2 isoform X2 n=1 Tax=Capricornis sumatraensis TaxID=34865 RepID=UPI003604F5C7
MADVEDGEEPCALSSHSGSAGSKSGGDKMFSLKKWNAVAMWSWDVECDTCAICRVQVMDACLRCQAENKQEDCVDKTQEGLPWWLSGKKSPCQCRRRCSIPGPAGSHMPWSN